MDRMKGISDGEANFIQGLVFRGAKSKLGQVPEPVRLMARSSSVMWAGGLFELASMRGKAVDADLKTLASIKVSSMVGCLF
jgi:hypothetical protein